MAATVDVPVVEPPPGSARSSKRRIISRQISTGNVFCFSKINVRGLTSRINCKGVGFSLVMLVILYWLVVQALQRMRFDFPDQRLLAGGLQVAEYFEDVNSK